MASTTTSICDWCLNGDPPVSTNAEYKVGSLPANGQDQYSCSTHLNETMQAIPTSRVLVRKL